MTARWAGVEMRGHLGGTGGLEGIVHWAEPAPFSDSDSLHSRRTGPPPWSLSSIWAQRKGLLARGHVGRWGKEGGLTHLKAPEYPKYGSRGEQAHWFSPVPLHS